MGGATRQAAAIGILGSRIGRRFIALFTGCTVLPLVLFAWLAVTRTTEQMRREQLALLHNGAKTAGMGIAARLSQVAGDLSLAREFAQHRDRGGADVVVTLQRHVGERCDAVWVVDGDETRSLCGDRPLSLPALQPAQRKHLATGRPVLDVVGQPPQLVMYAAVEPRAADGPLVAAHIRPQWFWDPEELRAAGCEVAAFDSHWCLLFHTFGSAPDTRAFLLAEQPQKSSGTVEWEVAGTPHLARYWQGFLSPQYACDLFVVMSRPMADAFAVSGEFTWWFLMTAMCTLLLVLVTSMVQMRRTLGPIVALHEATGRVAAGELQTRVSIQSHDEFGELGASFNDMTAQLQENIRRREQTELELVTSRDVALAAANAKAEFVTNVSHELRTPMTEILSAAEILAGLGDGDPETREEFTGIALRGAQRLARLVDNVLELGTTNVWAMAPVDVEATLLAAVDAVPAKHRARIRIEAPGELPCVLGNAERLTETWARLLDNAVKFSAPDTAIDVRVQCTGRDVVVEVADRGVGISPPDLARVFEPFTQFGRDQLTDKADGTGLGLTLAKNAVERHGGRIDVDSEPGAGSTFRVVLPAHAELLAARA